MGKFPESILAHKYCIGHGLEIGGAAHNPFGLDTLNVDLTDSMDTVFKQEEIQNCGIALQVDIVANGDNIPLPNCSQDFIVSSHVLEHFSNPIKALLEWDRLVKWGGVIFMIVPHKERTFDINNPRTTLQHLIDDYTNHETNPHSNQPINTHDHCWITEDIIHLIQWMVDNLDLHWKIIDIQDQDDKARNGFTIVIRKDKHCGKVTISDHP
jgi:ubiquinone/menaquinone biosynthesis C-methylase UbiE